ncbi:hypothetical protein EfmJHP36_05630 [Enterococcus faecium]|nr:hypothetical protein EfmJHP36_05630 [Enterococcus faecium]
MSIVMSRVDNRLLHGIIVTQWAPMSKANRVMVIDDSVANNDIQKSSMRLAKPRDDSYYLKNTININFL